MTNQSGWSTPQNGLDTVAGSMQTSYRDKKFDFDLVWKGVKKNEYYPS